MNGLIGKELSLITIDFAKSRTALTSKFLILFIFVLISSCAEKGDNYAIFYPSDDSVKDIDGNVYHTVYVMGQTWMVENLKTTHYRNGDTIQNVNDPAAWGKLKTGAYCNYNQDTGKVRTYGRLYNWYAVNRGNLCPYPFHVPYDYEWQRLVDTLGGLGVAGGLLKETGTAHWLDNTGATGQYGFKALPGGSLNADSGFREIGVRGYWWCNTNPADFALSRSMNAGNTNVDRLEQKKEMGLSVRCIRDY